ncbi:MAG: cupin domain-containing protein, partial [Gammaproteobacteria bacterium]
MMKLQRKLNHSIYNASRFVVKPNNHTKYHNHHEIEVFITISGEGLIKIDGNDVSLKSGVIIELEPLKTHIIFNTSDKNDLIICSFWWNDNDHFHNSIKNKFLELTEIGQHDDVHFILPSFTTPNGNLHVGHIAGPLLAADILKRNYNLNKFNAYLLTGTIGHQTQVQIEADKLGKTFLETALFYSEKIRQSMEYINIQPDCFITLENKDNLIMVSNLFIDRLLK